MTEKRITVICAVGCAVAGRGIVKHAARRDAAVTADCGVGPIFILLAVGQWAVDTGKEYTGCVSPSGRAVAVVSVGGGRMEGAVIGGACGIGVECGAGRW